MKTATKEATEDGIKITKLYGGKVEVKFMGPTTAKPSRHIYYAEGERRPSPSGIIGIKDKSRALVPWALEEAAKHLFPILESGKKITQEDIVNAVFASEKSKMKAADLGTAIHAWVESYINFKLKKCARPDMPEDAKILTGVNSFLEWEAAHKVKFLWAEKLVYSREYKFVGTADFAAVVDGNLCLCDNKTGNGLYNPVRMQTAAYAMADMEESRVKYDGRWAIRIAKETEEEYVERMAFKNCIKELLGKEPSEVKPYQVFEAVFLDTNKGSMADDFDAFLHCKALTEWDKRTDAFANGGSLA